MHTVADIGYHQHRRQNRDVDVVFESNTKSSNGSNVLNGFPWGGGAMIQPQKLRN